ncbi:MAG TPA: SGNH hydrolase domain-containing protein, partial [Acidimicrobiales bacterium]|nr:SGNH hydrolase domain-containing protein [Acidimicrobiales bacterium]
TAGTALVLAALELGPPGPVHRVLGAPAPAAVGRVSYSLYLWHWPVLVLAPLLAVRWQREWIDDRPAMFAAMGGFAVASYLAFERPIRFRLAPGARPVAVVVAGLVLTGVVAVPAAERLLPSDRDERIALAAVRDLSAPGPCPYFPRDWPAPDDARVCTWREGGDRSILLVGDSHAQMWLPAVEHVAERYDLTVYRVTRGGCPVNDVLVYHLDDIDGSKVPDHDCSEWRANLYRRAVAELDPDVVLASTRSHILGIKDGDRYLLPRDDEHRAVWRDGLVRSLGWLTAGSGVVVVSEILPTLPERVPACLAEHGLSTRACDWPVSVDRRVRSFNELIRTLPSAVPEVVTIDLTPLACPDGRCRAMADDVVVHRDDNHLSRSYVATLGDPFEALLRNAGVVFGQSTNSRPATAAQAQ